MAITKIQLDFGKDTNTILDKPGHTVSESGKLSWEAANKKGLVNNLHLERNTDVLMLKPVVDLKEYSTVIGEWTMERGEWEIVTVPDADGITLFHQYNSAESDWYLTAYPGVYTLLENQGFIFMFSKFVDPGDKTMTLEVGSKLKFEFQKRKSIVVYYNNQELGKIQPVKHYVDNNLGMELDFFICYFIDKYIIVSMNGFENTQAFTAPDGTYSYKEYAAGVYRYPVLLEEDPWIRIIGSGNIYLALKQLYYESQGSIESSYIMPGYQLLSFINEPRKKLYDPLEEVAVQLQSPLSASGSGENYRYKYKLYLTGINYGTPVAGYSGITPYVYGWQISSPQTFSSPSSSPSTLTSDIISYRERIGGDGFGNYTPGTCNIVVECYNTYRSNLEAKNAKINVQLGTDANGLTQKGVYYADQVVTNWSGFNQLQIEILGKDSVKKCQNQIVFAEKELDDLLHTELMQKLADQAKIEIQMDSSTNDPKFPGVDDSYPANWKFTRGQKIWQAMQTIRTFSGWLLYPNANGILQYRKRNKKSTTPVAYTFSTEQNLDGNIPIESVRYIESDVFRTRIYVFGTASEDAKPVDNWPYNGQDYKSGEPIVAMHINSNLEDEIGESRPGIFVDSGLGNYAAVAWACNNLAKYYTKKHTYVSFTVPYAEDILDLWIYDGIRIIDSRLGKTDKYQVLSIETYATKMSIQMNIQAQTFVS